MKQQCGRFARARQGDHRLSLMVLKSSDDHEAASSPYRHVNADTPKSIISTDRLLVACGTRPVRSVPVLLLYQSYNCKEAGAGRGGICRADCSVLRVFP